MLETIKKRIKFTEVEICKVEKVNGSLEIKHLGKVNYLGAESQLKEKKILSELENGCIITDRKTIENVYEISLEKFIKNGKIICDETVAEVVTDKKVG